MKRILTWITALTTLFFGMNGFEALAESVEYTDGLRFSFVTNASNEQYYRVKSYTGSETEITIPDTYNGYPVKEIGSSAFVYSDITSIHFSDNITTISPSAFAGCEYLSSLILPENLEVISGNAFRGCTQLSSVQFNTKLETIGDQAFLGCTSITELYIPPNVVDISMSAFMDCTSLLIVTGGEGLTRISNQMFSRCENLHTVNIGDNIQSIGINAFSGCKNLVNIVVPDSVEYIASGAFPAYIPYISNQSTDIKYAGRWVIDCDEDSTDFSIAEGTIGICSSAFSDCQYLNEIVIPDTINYIGSGAFSGTPLFNQQETAIKYADEWVIGCDKSVVDATIREGTVGICGYAFSDCTQMENIDIPDSVKYIGEYAFNCTKLRSIYIPQSVELLGDYLFSMCSRLRVVYLCESNEYVETYMHEQYPDVLLEFYADTAVLGDANADGNIDAVDAANILVASAAIGSGGESGLTETQEQSADVNGDGAFDAVDAAVVLCYAAAVGSGYTGTLEEFLAA